MTPCPPQEADCTSQEDYASLLATDEWLLTWERGRLPSPQAQYDFLAVQACSAMRLSSLPMCPRTTKVVQLLDCNIMWAAFPVKQLAKMLALQGLLQGGGVTREAAQAAFAAAGADPDSAPLTSLQTLLRPMAAQHFFQAAKRKRV